MKKNISRRELIKKSSAFIALSCFKWNYPLKESFSCCDTPILDPGSYHLNQDHLEINLNKALAIQKTGDAAYYKNEDIPVNIIIIKNDKKQYSVLDRSCTHAGRDVSYVKDRELVQCNNFSHSTFSLKGNVVKGPAKRPLKQYDVFVNENQLVIRLK